MLKPNIEELKEKIEAQHFYFPVALSISVQQDEWFPLYKELTNEARYHILLESGRAGRYSVIAYQPTHAFVGKDQELQIKTLDRMGHITQTEFVQGDLLDLLRSWMTARKAPVIPGLPDFKGGLLGFYSYDLIRQIEELERISLDDLETPDLYLLAFERVLVYDHQQNQHWLLLYHPINHSNVEESYREAQHHLENWSQEIERTLSQLRQKAALNQGESDHQESQEMKGNAASGQGVVPSFETRSLSFQPSFSEGEFVQAVEKIQEYIAAGDVFQINLSVRQSRVLEQQPIELYEQLRKINPSPYMGYLHFPEIQIVSASPEQLIKVQGAEVNTRPIAGTRPRGANREEDLKLATELIENEKERAEHVMLVDLERNDLGKVCQYGSVEVDEFMVIEEYSHVMHIVSNVKGTLRPDMDAFDVIRAVFPGGTITGAPKVRTMEIIEELEPVRRGIYTGSIGWIDFCGEMELNIVIRTMLVKDSVGHVQAGAGIVIDSIPENEYKESLKKAEALWKAYELSRKEKIRDEYLV